MHAYELALIAEPGLDDEGLDALVERVKSVITDNGGEVTKVDNRGKRRLAYLIKKKREGYYVFFEANLDNPAISELQRSLRLAEDVLRHMLVRVDEEPVPVPEEATEAASEEPVPVPEEATEAASEEPVPVSDEVTEAE